MVVAGLRFDTSGASPSRWQSDMRSGSGYVVRHPAATTARRATGTPGSASNRRARPARAASIGRMSALADSYALTDDQLAFRDTIRQMVRERVAPRAAEIDEKAEYPWDLRQLFAEHDLFGLPFEEEHGGTGTGALMLCIAIEEVAKACASSALMLAVQDLGTLPISCSAARS